MVVRVLTLSQASLRRPGVYTLPRFLAMMPSRPASRAASNSASPSSTVWLTRYEESFLMASAIHSRRRSSGSLDQRPPVEVEAIEHVADGRVLAPRARGGALRCLAHAIDDVLEHGAAGRVQAHDLAVEQPAGGAKRRRRRRTSSGNAAVMSFWLRERMRTTPSSSDTMARMPSHFTS